MNAGKRLSASPRGMEPYLGLNMDQFWTMVHRDLPELEEQVRQIRSQIASDSVRGE
jgi:uncharacterized protein with HEPN domain